MTLAEAYLWGSQELKQTSETASLDAEVLLSELLGCSRAHLIAYPEQVLSPENLKRYQAFILRRQQGEPLAYIVGHKEFWSLDLRVTPDTLVPRPETELLVELTLGLVPQKGAKRIADLGTGSGAVALALSQERPEWEIYATDQSAPALAIAQQNARNLGLTGVKFSQGTWCQALPDLRFDAIVSNPPYLSEQDWQVRPAELNFEPRSALVSAEEGLHDIRDIAESAKNYLLPGAFLLVEHGATQGLAVRRIFEKAGYTETCTYQDLAGRERITSGAVQHKYVV